MNMLSNSQYAYPSRDQPSQRQSRQTVFCSTRTASSDVCQATLESGPFRPVSLLFFSGIQGLFDFDA